MSWKLNLGSCLDPVSGLASLADDSVDVTITDPPYEAEAHTKILRVKNGNASRGGEVIPFAAITEDDRDATAANLARVTRRWVLVFCQVEGSSRWASSLVAAGLQYVRTMVWVKPDAQPQITGDRPGMGYESLVFAHAKGRSAGP